jgi:hypothetical protein
MVIIIIDPDFTSHEVPPQNILGVRASALLPGLCGLFQPHFTASQLDISTTIPLLYAKTRRI